MNVGVLVEAEEGLDWPAWRRTFGAAERLGFESVWISDHLQSPWAASRHGLDAWTALAVAAAETARVIVGPLVTPITFRAPGILARMAESLDQLSGGRLIVGLGLGWNAEEHAAAGIRFPSAPERSRLLEEGIQQIRGMLCGRPVPLLIGGTGVRSTLPLVARYADEWNVTTSSAEAFRAAADQLDAFCQQMGRDPSAIHRSAAMGVLVGRTPSELRARAERMRTLVEPLARAERMRTLVEPLALADDVCAAARDMGWLVGLPADIVAGLRALRQAGVQRAILGHYDTADVGSLELLAETVVPVVA